LLAFLDGYYHTQLTLDNSVMMTTNLTKTFASGFLALGVLAGAVLAVLIHQTQERQKFSGFRSG
jgi:Zn-dependent oligopeptidase